MKSQIDLLKKECFDSKIEKTFPESLELLEEFRRIKIYNKGFLKNITVLFIQHHLQPFIGRLKIMKEDGMVKDNTWFIDIPYSTNKEVLEKIKAEYTNHKYPEPYLNPLINYTSFQLERTKSIIKEIIKSEPFKLLVIDDGAYFIRAVHELYIHESVDLGKLWNRTYIVEQTTRGHRYLQNKKYSSIIKILNTSIVSIARSKTKIDLESPFIGIACNRAIKKNKRILQALGKHNEKEDKQLKIGIIGYGAIGEAVFESIKELINPPYDIDIVEIDYDKWVEIKAKQGKPIAELAKNKYDLLFGCTGYKSFDWNDRNKVNTDGLLVSVSSAAVEFSRCNYIEFAELYPDDPIEIKILEEDKGIHSDLYFIDGQLKFHFINSGFPINFTGERECLPLKFIQPTHALLYAASYQVLEEPEAGLQELKKEYDNWIYFNAYA